MSETKVVTKRVRFCFVYVFERRTNADGTEGKYQSCILIPKKDKATISKIERAIEAAAEAGKSSKFDGRIPKRWKNPVLKDGDEERPDDEAFEGMMFINASSNSPIKVVDRDPSNAIIDPEEFYSGVWGRASLNFAAYNFEGNKGIGCYINSLQKLEDGERLGGNTSNPEADFDNEDDDEDFM